MRNMFFSILTALMFFAATAIAQTTPSTSDQTGTTPSASSPSRAQGQAQSDPSSAAQNPGYGNPGNQGTKEGEKKMKGCVKEQGGQYLLETKTGKDIPLSGEGLSAHVGHEVAVHGAWAGGGDMSGMSGGSKSSTGNEKMFNVTSIDHLSDTCGGKHSKTGASTTQPQ